MTNKYKCPCCGKEVFNEEHMYEVCPNCGWEDDPIQFTHPDFEGGANFYSLNHFKDLVQQGKNANQIQSKDLKTWQQNHG